MGCRESVRQLPNNLALQLLKRESERWLSRGLARGFHFAGAAALGSFRPRVLRKKKKKRVPSLNRNGLSIACNREALNCAESENRLKRQLLLDPGSAGRTKSGAAGYDARSAQMKSLKRRRTASGVSWLIRSSNELGKCAASGCRAHECGHSQMSTPQDHIGERESSRQSRRRSRCDDFGHISFGERGPKKTAELLAC
jgi:hypothetical protein